MTVLLLHQDAAGTNVSTSSRLLEKEGVGNQPHTSIGAKLIQALFHALPSAKTTTQPDDNSDGAVTPTSTATTSFGGSSSSSTMFQPLATENKEDGGGAANGKVTASTSMGQDKESLFSMESQGSSEEATLEEMMEAHLRQKLAIKLANKVQRLRNKQSQLEIQSLEPLDSPGSSSSTNEVCTICSKEDKRKIVQLTVKYISGIGASSPYQDESKATCRGQNFP